jgi:hypothetical protein
MADSLSFKMVTKPFTDFLDFQQKQMRRGAMYSLRETGRVVKREAKSRAPVLSDKSAVSNAQHKRNVKAGVSSGPGPVRGLLKASIGSSRRLKLTGLDSWSLKVGPRGVRVHLYAGKIETQHPYMAPARSAAEAQSAAIAAKTYAKIWKA